MVRAVFVLILLGMCEMWPAGALAVQTVIVPVADNPNYANAQEQMQALVNMWGFHRSNQFCTMGYAPADHTNDVTAYVYWPTQTKLIQWAAADGDGEMQMGGMAGSREFIDLRKLWPDDKPVPMSMPAPWAYGYARSRTHKMIPISLWL